MKISGSALVGCEGALLIIVIVMGGLVPPAYCKTADISLFVQQTPDAGGAVNPVAGVYHYTPNSEISLTATPNPGYQFVYWLGDVSDPKTTTTVVRLDKPKIVIAVFDQTDSAISSGGLSGGGGGLAPTAVNLSQGSPISGTSGAQPKTKAVYMSPGSKEPVVPEPATGILLGLGSLLAFVQRRRKRPQ